MATYILVKPTPKPGDDGTEDTENTEVPIGKDGTLNLTTVQALFPGAIGLKYKNPDTGNMRSLVSEDGALVSPEGGWGEHVYLAVEEPPAQPTKTTEVVEERQETSDGATLDTQAVDAQAAADAAAAEAAEAAKTAQAAALAASAKAAGLSEPCPKIFVGHLPFTIATPQHLHQYVESL